MFRRSQHGPVAVIVVFLSYIMFSIQPVTHAGSPGLPRRVFLPMVSKGAPFLSATEQEAFNLINQHRRANGCPAVQMSRELSAASKTHSRDMAVNSFVSHTGADGSSFGQRAVAAQYLYFPSGETIAAGRSTASATVTAWMNSPGHRAIILTCANDDLGIGLYVLSGSPYTYYWTAVFGQR